MLTLRVRVPVAVPVAERPLAMAERPAAVAASLVALVAMVT